MVATHDFLDGICFGGVVLDTLGGLYLAYDLLGGERGPLRLATKALTYGVAYFIGYGVFLGRWFGLVGAIIHGPALALEHMTQKEGPTGFAWIYPILRGVSLGIAGWLTLDIRFGIAFGLLGTVGLILAYVFVGAAGFIDSAWTPPKINRQVLIRGSSRGVAFGLAAVISAMVLHETREIWFGLRIGIVSGTVSAIFLIFSPSIDWWADHLPARRLGGYGAFLVVIGSAMQSLQYLLPILGVRVI